MDECYLGENRCKYNMKLIKSLEWISGNISRYGDVFEEWSSKE